MAAMQSADVASANEHEQAARAAQTTTAQLVNEVSDELLAEYMNLEADDDSTYGFSINSGSTSISSKVFRGMMEHGRRYQTVRGGHGEYFVPADDKQFESMEAVNVMFKILESWQENPLFRSPISEKAQHVLDLGTGDGSWAIDVADAFPSQSVRGVDLYPPPQNYVPPNCVLEVDDMLKPWTWDTKFDLVHMRLLLGSFGTDDLRLLYKQAYNNMQPGGWIEHIEVKVDILCDDNGVPHDPCLKGYGRLLSNAASKSGRSLDLYYDVKPFMESAGFTNIQEKVFKEPIGPWAKIPRIQGRGLGALAHFKKGLEGWAMYIPTKIIRGTDPLDPGGGAGLRRQGLS